MSDAEQGASPEQLEQNIILSFDSHSRLSEFDRLVYPVVSRRSGGLSLGINLNPDKRCNFDCVYCQVERDQPLLKQEPSLLQLEQELRQWLEQICDRGYRGYPLKDIGLAGDGEPTTVKILPEVLRLLLELKREYRLPDEVKLVLFSNATGLDRKDLASLWPQFYAANGEIWCKLDCWDQASLDQLNRSSVSFDRLLSKIMHFGRQYPLVLQSCLFSWQGQLFERSYYDGYIALVERLLAAGVKLAKIQAYTLARQPAEAQAKPWSNTEMDRLAALLRQRLPVAIELFYESGSEVD
jgi:wyosine [tRNA(Phe)-imidazoG37] synthetase (radical SAM superfamily)